MIAKKKQRYWKKEKLLCKPFCLSIFKSNKYIYIQIIKITTNQTLWTFSTKELQIQFPFKNSNILITLLSQYCLKFLLQMTITNFYIRTGSKTYNGQIKKLIDILLNSLKVLPL